MTWDDSENPEGSGDFTAPTIDQLWAEEGVEDGQELIDMSSKAFWTVSSSKEEHGVVNLTDDSPYTFWQSDGAQPHIVDIQFSKRVELERFEIFLDYQQDESYTPSEIALFAGTGLHDLVRISVYELDRPEGWFHLLLNETRKDGFLKCFMLRLTITANHDNGRDTRVRAIRLLGPPVASDHMGWR